MKSLQELISIHGDREISEETTVKIFGNVKQWTPEYRETYWYIGDNGGVYDSGWRGSRDWSGDSTDILRWRMGNVYRTEEEAEFASDKKQFLVKMERDFENNSDPIDWKNKDQNKFCIYIDHYEQELDIDSTSGYETSTLVTTNIDWLRQYIKDNEANIKKYVFGVRK